jgi:hypothetical protein
LAGTGRNGREAASGKILSRAAASPDGILERATTHIFKRRRKHRQMCQLELMRAEINTNISVSYFEQYTVDHVVQLNNRPVIN